MKKHLLAWVAIGIVLMGCSSKKSQLEAEFMNGCMESGGGHEKKKICSCALEKLEARYSIDDLFTLAQQQPQKLLQETLSFAPSCTGEIGLDLSVPKINENQDVKTQASSSPSPQTASDNSRQSTSQMQGDGFKARFGQLSINEYSQLVFDGRIVRPGVQANSSLAIKESFNLGSEDIFIVENTGGTACPALFNFVVIGSNGAQSFPTFGTCSDIYQARINGNSITVQMQGENNVPHSYIFSDHVVTDNGKKIEPPTARDFSVDAVIEDADGFTNIRAQSNGKSAIIGRVASGESFRTHPQDSEWWAVKTMDGRTGFMHRSRIVLLQNQYLQ